MCLRDIYMCERSHFGEEHGHEWTSLQNSHRGREEWQTKGAVEMDCEEWKKAMKKRRKTTMERIASAGRPHRCVENLPLTVSVHPTDHHCASLTTAIWRFFSSSRESPPSSRAQLASPPPPPS